MIILGSIAVGVLGALSARTAVHFADAVFHAAEEYRRKSTHRLCGHKFVVYTNSQYAVLERAFKTINDLADNVVQDANLESADAGPIAKFLLEGVLLWGSSGADIRSVILSKAPEHLAQDISDAVIHHFESLTPERKEDLYTLYRLVA